CVDATLARQVIRKAATRMRWLIPLPRERSTVHWPPGSRGREHRPHIPPRPQPRNPGSGMNTIVHSVSRAKSLQEARSHLHAADPVIARLIDARPDFDPHAWIAQLPPMDLYGSLLFQIAGQQLSVAATRRTLERIQALFGGHLPSPVEL